jgi:hypothetical protein
MGLAVACMVYPPRSIHCTSELCYYTICMSCICFVLFQVFMVTKSHKPQMIGVLVSTCSRLD